MKSTIDVSSKNAALQNYAVKLGNAAKSLHETSMHLVQLAMKERPEVFLSDATLYLEMFGIVTVSWLWLKQALVAQTAIDNKAENEEYLFYQGKVHTMKYYFEYELPKIQPLIERLMSAEKLTLDIESAYIN